MSRTKWGHRSHFPSQILTLFPAYFSVLLSSHATQVLLLTHYLHTIQSQVALRMSLPGIRGLPSFPYTFCPKCFCSPVPRSCCWIMHVIFLLPSGSTLHPWPLCPLSRVSNLQGLHQHVTSSSGFQLVWPVESSISILKGKERSVDVYFSSFLPMGCPWATWTSWLVTHCSSQGAMCVLHSPTGSATSPQCPFGPRVYKFFRFNLPWDNILHDFALSCMNFYKNVFYYTFFKLT